MSSIWILVIYLLGLPLTAGLIDGIGNFASHHFSMFERGTKSSVVADCTIVLFWPLFWIVWPIYNLGLLVHDEW